MFIPVLAVFFNVLRDETDKKLTLNPEAAAKVVLSSFFNHNTFLILGGYAISAAFSRCEVERRLASLLQARFENQPYLFLLAMMMLGMFLSMWISNHTAPVLCISVLSPIIADYGSESRFVQALLLGVAFACNFGGMLTPIASLQNIIAIQQMNNAESAAMSFGAWIGYSMPIALLGTIFAWLLIIVMLKPDDVTSIPKIVYEAKEVNKSAIAICVLSLLTILAWATSSFTKLLFGDLGIISLLFMGIVFGSGILTEIDLNSFAWHTLFLLGGSNVLGKVVESSELLDHIVHALKHALPESKLWVAAEVFFAACVMATFVSHSVAAIVVVPIIAHIGKSWGAVQEFSFGSALAISAAMAFPFSSFPNIYSLLVVDDFGKSFLSTKMFLQVGTPASMFCIFLIVMWTAAW
ncbi:hypothetical protein TrST_g3430 [Triparma strigata]|uniref:Citrate transporter-like domain-containing protein n=1 Tax=Triparma strigata TaxID=1606541 RepID=A0A9W7AC52_9STRA|nr:hypothetical protein TrST_g3430 [Triparma strigata]